MSRDRLRAAARLKTTAPRADYRSMIISGSFIILAAFIGASASTVTSYINGQNDKRKIAVEQAILFEKEVSNNTSKNLLITEQAIDFFDAIPWKLDLQKIDTSNIPLDWRFRTVSIQLLMNSYVNIDLSSRFQKLNDTLFILWVKAVKNLANRPNDPNSPQQDFKRYNRSRRELMTKEDTLVLMYKDFMHDLHAAILN